MSKIDELIKEYCPDGVKYKELDTFCNIITGSKPKKILENPDKYYYINAGISLSGYAQNFNTEGNVVTTPSRGQGGIGYVNYQKNNFWLGPLCYSIRSNEKIALNKFLYYYLSTKKDYIRGLKKEGSIPAINKSDLQNIKIPIPPLPVQEAIVERLDDFTTMQAELKVKLQVELVLRKKQYSYYQEKLLTFDENNPLYKGKLEYKEISKFASVSRGKRLTKDLLSNDEIYPVYHGGLEPLGYYSKFNRPRNTVMVINVGASAGTIGYSDVDFWSSDGCFCIETSSKINNKYLYYFLQTNEFKLKSKVRYAGIPTLDAFVVEDTIIPIPPLHIQQQIVEILDSFSLASSGLIPLLEREIELGEKRYSYYRDKLLIFKEK